MSTKNKDELLKNLYYHELGYQSISRLFQEAKKISENITLAYGKDRCNYFNQRRTQLRGQTSSIAPRLYWEYQADLFLFTRVRHPKHRASNDRYIH